jgi:single-stranded DNA-binding protein
MHKGDPILVKGKFQTRTYEDKDGNPKTEARITADTVGHDLSRGVANYMRNRSWQSAQDEGPAEGQAPEGWAPEGQSSGNQNMQRWPGPGGMIDEDAVERFGRDLDDADVAAHALADDRQDEDEEDGDTTDAAAPPVAASF